MPSRKKPPATDLSARDLASLPFKEAVRQKPGLYFGGAGPHVLPRLIRSLIDWAFGQAPKYKEVIDVDCSRENGRQRFALTFHGLNLTRFRPDNSSAWEKV